MRPLVALLLLTLGLGTLRAQRDGDAWAFLAEKYDRDHDGAIAPG